MALNILKALRIISRVFGTTVIAAQNQVCATYSCKAHGSHCIVQASQEMFDIFDKVLVLQEGQCIYFGPTKDALPHFAKLGKRQSYII